MFRVSPVRSFRHHDGCDGLEPLDGLSRFVQPPHMRIARRETIMDICGKWEG